MYAENGDILTRRGRQSVRLQASTHRRLDVFLVKPNKVMFVTCQEHYKIVLLFSRASVFAYGEFVWHYGSGQQNSLVVCSTCTVQQRNKHNTKMGGETLERGPITHCGRA